MRLYNFSAGPAMLPDEVLQQVQNELTDWHGLGTSVMEMSHRGLEFTQIAQKAEQNLRELMSIPDNYQVLFLPGGATTQFAMVPINLLRGGKKAAYIHTGIWSAKAIKEAKRFCRVHIAYSSESDGFCHAPNQTDLDIPTDCAYVHYTPNETIDGVVFDYTPDTGDIPLIADMSSMILSQPIDISRFGLIYAGAQKNIGSAGVTVVVVRSDLLGAPIADMPRMYDYQIHASHQSMWNTPPTFAWYISGLMFEWLLRQGGVKAMARINQRKADMLYQCIDEHALYANHIASANRSLMNVPFTLNQDKDEALNQAFIQFAKSKGLLSLKGHKSVGGMRASIYNAMPEAGVEALVACMQEFALLN